MNHSNVLEIENTEGERFTEVDCPSRIKETINSAVARGQRVGVVYGGGSRWHWATTSGQSDTVELQFTRDDEVIQRYQINWQSWEAWKIVAARNSMSPEQYLIVVLATAMAEDGATLPAMIEWLFSGKEAA